MARSCSLSMVLVIFLIVGPCTCRCNFVQHAVTGVLSWARHELAAWMQSAAPILGGFGPQCMDAQGNAVEWWAAIKPPSTRDLLYIDSSTSEADPTRWRFRAVSGESTTPVERTLQQLQSSSGGQAFGHVMYSDDAPRLDGTPAADSPDAALKQGRGILGFGPSAGFWITHSLPSFPIPPGHASPAGFPIRAQPHAHSLLCVSAAAGQLRSLAGTLQKNRFNVYSRAPPSDMRGWSLEDQNAAAELLLQDPVASADGKNDAEPDVVLNEFSGIGGERFVILGNNGSKSEVHIVDNILGSFFGSPMLRSSQYWPRPCTASTSGYPNFQPRDLLEEASGGAWNASLERSHWQISFGEGQAPVRCQGGLWDPYKDAGTGGAPVAQALELAGNALVLEQEEDATSSSMRWVFAAHDAAMSARDKAEVAAEGRQPQTMTFPVTSTSRRRLLERVDSEREPLDTPGRTLAEFISYGTDSVARPLTSLAKQLAHRLLGSPEMAAELAMRRSVLSIPSMLGAAQGLPQSEGSPGLAGQRGSFFGWLPASVWPLFEILRGRQPAGKEQALYQPQDDSYSSAASELLAMHNRAVKEEAASDGALSIQKEVQRGLAMELRLTGATSTLPQQAAQPGQYTAPQSAAADEDTEEDCTGSVGAMEELKCRAHSLQQQGRALERLVDRLEAAAAGEAAVTGQTSWEEARMRGHLAGDSLRQWWEKFPEGRQMPQGEGLRESWFRKEWEEGVSVQAGEPAGCTGDAGGAPLPEEKHAVCFRDRGRSLEAGGLPGGAVCFGGHEGLWHALRALVRTYEYCV